MLNLLKIKESNFLRLIDKKYDETIENHWFAGPVNAINKGLEKASGDWIARIDDDDLWTNDHLKSLFIFCYKK